MDSNFRKLASALDSKQEQVPTVGDVRADPASNDWRLSFRQAPLSGHMEVRGQFSFEFKFESKNHILTYRLNDRCIEFIQQVMSREDRRADNLSHLGRGDPITATGLGPKSQRAGMAKQFGKLMKLDNIVDLATLVQQEGERVRAAGKEEAVMMEAMVRRHRDLLDEMGGMLRHLPEGIVFLRKLINSEDEQTVRLALFLSERVGQLELQEEIRELAANENMSRSLQDHAFALLMPEQQWQVWEARAAARHRRRRGD